MPSSKKIKIEIQDWPNYSQRGSARPSSLTTDRSAYVLPHTITNHQTLSIPA